MKATGTIRDEWLEQADVQAYFSDASAWGGEWITVYEVRNSYVEHFYGILLPVKAQRVPKTTRDPSWSRDFDYTKGQIAKVRIGHTQYLGLRFRRFLELNFGTHGVLQDPNLIYRRKVQDCETQKSDTIFVRRDAVVKFVQDSKQVLLWCVRSQRFSERQLHEFGLAEKYEPIRTENCCYDFCRRDLDERRQRKRPRMATMTQTFGKSVVKL